MPKCCFELRPLTGSAGYLLAALSIACANGPKTSIGDLKEAYSRAKTVVERRAVCIKAIDEGIIFEKWPLIGAGSSLQVVDEIFGEQPLGQPWKDAWESRGGSLRVIDLSRGLDAESSTEAELRYFAVDGGSDVPHSDWDRVTSYRLCNCMISPQTTYELRPRLHGLPSYDASLCVLTRLRGLG